MRTQKLWKKLLSSILMAIIILGQFSAYRFTSRAEVVTTGQNDILYLKLSKTNQDATSPIGYGFGMDSAGSGKAIWSFMSGDSNDSNYKYAENLYCIKAENGTTWATNQTQMVTYNQSYAIPLAQNTESTVANDMLTGTYSNEILWIIDNMYIPEESTEQDMADYLEAAGIKYIAEESGYVYTPSTNHNYTDIPSVSNTYEDTVTKTDIVAIQQMAIWYYTNNGTNSAYNKLTDTSWIQETVDGTNYTELADDKTSGRGPHAEVLYRYLVNEASRVAQSLASGETYKLENVTAKLWLSINTTTGADNAEQPVIEIHKKPEFDLALRKAILSVQNADGTKQLNNVFGEVADREINVNKNTLSTDTTATYGHRKDPIVVEEGDIVEYAIIIYNEAKADGYAKKIVDQLPGTVSELRLENTNDITSSTGNVYEVTYSTTTNKIELNLKSENPVSIASYDGTTLSSETIRLRCVVEADPEKDNAKILTNIAYISAAYNSETGEEITTNIVGADRDSAPGAYPTYQGSEDDNMQDGVTYWNTTSPDYGYTGNSNNSTDLSDNETYYKGIEDDDDFEKIMIMPKTEITVNKVWNDNNNQDGKRTEYEVTLIGKVGETTVYENSQTLAAGTLTYTWENLDRYSNGQKIEYTVDETKVPEEYTKKVEANESKTVYTITNSYNPEKTEITVNKVWNDNNNQDGKRTEYEVTLIGKVGERTEYENSQTLAAGTLTYTWENLDRYSNGQKIEYTVDETKVPEEYTKKVEANESKTVYTITNSYTPKTTQITVNKEWADSNNQDGIRPETVTVVLKANGNEVDRKEIAKTGNWTYTFTNLPEYKDGTKITYTIEEIQVTGYTSSQSEKVEDGNKVITIKNEHIPEIVSKSVLKIWDDKNNQDGIRPNSIEVQLYADGEKYGEAVTLTAGEDGIWQHSELSYTWNTLPKNKEGKLIVYSVKEVNIEEGYKESYGKTGDAEEIETFTITNTHLPETIEISVEKQWDDSDNQYGVRPNSVKVQLYANGNLQGQPIELKASDNWKYTWENLPKKENGQDIQYTVKELNSKNQAVEDGKKYNDNYITTYRITENKTTITNTQLTFDLKLIKYISAINNDKVQNRLQNVDLSKLNTYDGNLKKWISTGEYTLEKSPVKVELNDYVTYTFRVYNEGNYDGYATEISEDIPEGLQFIAVGDGQIWSWDGTTLEDITEEIKESEMYETIVNTNSNWGYKQDTSIITTSSLSEELIKGFGKENVEYADEENRIDYKEISVIFRVKKDVKANLIIRNEAAISIDKAVDEEGKEIAVDDRDSQPGNTDETWKKEDSDKTYDEEGQWPIYKEDDEDYDNIITKTFDLSLRKQIVQVNDGLYTKRFAKLDPSNQYGNTLYNYYDVYSEKPKVKAGDIVTYSIRVYNEGTIDGYASLIVDTLPSGLEFVEYEEGDGSINETYGWVLKEANIYQTDYLSYERDANKGTAESTILKAYTGEGEASYQELYIECRVKEDVTKEDSLLNVAQIAEDSDENGNPIKDKDSVPGVADDEQQWKKEDDLDIEILELQEFDLALRKFITAIENGEDIEEVTTRIPQVSYDKEKQQLIYTHSKDALVVHVGDTVIYTLRVYNEGDIDGYASEVKDDIPEYLEYLPEHSTNIDNEWVMYDKEGNKTDNVAEAVCIRTEHLAKGKGAEAEEEGANLIESFDVNKQINETNPHYKELKVAFKVKDPNSTEYEIVNFAQISEDTDKNGEPINDRDSEPDNGEKEPKEDDEDIEKVKVEYFDLALLKYVTKVMVNENGEVRETLTGNVGDKNDIIPHVQINKKNIDKTVVKFAYTIKITNEGQIAGEATEITDYVPEGLVFKAEDNENWKDEGNNVISTRQLMGTTLQPGESAEVEVILTWINGNDNLGPKTNVAEISEDYNEENVPDRDSTPDNKKEGEDDIDEATVLLSVNQGGGIPTLYRNIVLIFLNIILVGGILIKKFVL